MKGMDYNDILKFLDNIDILKTGYVVKLYFWLKKEKNLNDNLISCDFNKPLVLIAEEYIDKGITFCTEQNINKIKSYINTYGDIYKIEIGSNMQYYMVADKNAYYRLGSSPCEDCDEYRGCVEKCNEGKEYDGKYKKLIEEFLIKKNNNMTIDFLKEIVDNEELSLDTKVYFKRPYSYNMRVFPVKLKENDDKIIVDCENMCDNDMQLTINDLLKYSNGINKEIYYTFENKIETCRGFYTSIIKIKGIPTKILVLSDCIHEFNG